MMHPAWVALRPNTTKKRRRRVLPSVRMAPPNTGAIDEAVYGLFGVAFIVIVASFQQKNCRRGRQFWNKTVARPVLRGIFSGGAGWPFRASQPAGLTTQPGTWMGVVPGPGIRQTWTGGPNQHQCQKFGNNSGADEGHPGGFAAA